MAGKAEEFPLALVIKAVDKATGPLREINAKIQRITAPAKQLGKSFQAFSDESGLTNVGKALGGVGRSVGKLKGELLSLGTKLAAVGVGAGFALYKMVRGSVDVGDKLGEVSQRLGFTADAYAQLSFAAAQSDVDQEKLNGAMDTFSKGVGQAKAGAGRFYSFLQKVSPTLAKNVRGSKSNADALGLMADAFAKVQDPAKRSALAVAAFGDPQMGVFLGQGSAALKELTQRYEQLAGPQERFAERSSILDNTFRELSTAFGGISNRVMSALFPAFNRLAILLTEFLAKNGDRLVAWAEKANGAFQAWLNSGGFERLVDGLKSVADTASRVIDGVGGMQNALILVSGVMAGPTLGATVELAGSMGKLVAAIVKVGFAAGSLAFGAVIGAIGNFIIAVRAGYTAMQAFNLVMIANPVGLVIIGLTALAALAFVVYKNWEPIKTFFASLWDTMKHPLEALKTAKEFYFGKSTEKPPPLAFSAPDSSNIAPLMRSTGSPAAGAQRSEAFVKVDFANLPAGTRVMQNESGTANLEISRGVQLGAH